MNGAEKLLRLVSVCDTETGACLFQRTWQWRGEQERSSIGKLVQSFYQFAREVDQGGAQTKSFYQDVFSVGHVHFSTASSLLVFFAARPGRQGSAAAVVAASVADSNCWKPPHQGSVWSTSGFRPLLLLCSLGQDNKFSFCGTL